MSYPFKPFFSRTMVLLSLLGLGFVQVGCAHPVVVEPSVAVQSRIGHFPVYAQVGLPAPVIYASTPQVIYAPPPPPRVIYAPQVYGPSHGWWHGHGHHFRGNERSYSRHGDGDYGRGAWGHRWDGRR